MQLNEHTRSINLAATLDHTGRTQSVAFEKRQSKGIMISSYIGFLTGVRVCCPVSWIFPIILAATMLLIPKTAAAHWADCEVGEINKRVEPKLDCLRVEFKVDPSGCMFSIDFWNKCDGTIKAVDFEFLGEQTTMPEGARRWFFADITAGNGHYVWNGHLTHWGRIHSITAEYEISNFDDSPNCGCFVAPGAGSMATMGSGSRFLIMFVGVAVGLRLLYRPRKVWAMRGPMEALE